MVSLNFFLKKVKSIVCENISYSLKLELLDKELYRYFKSYFAIYNFDGTLAFGNNNLKNLSMDSLNNISLHNDNLYNIKVKDYIGLNFEFLYGGLCPYDINNKDKVFILFYNREEKFTEEEMIILDGFATSIFLTYKLMSLENEKFEASNFERVGKVIGSLSYSEYEAMGYIFDSFVGDEAVIVASLIAKEKGITRSVIVSGLKKLANANLIKSYSLGNKGTFIKILDKDLREKI